MERSSNMTFEQWEMSYYKIHLELFGKREADKWLSDNLTHHTVLKELWMEKGFKTYGEYEAWEKDHIAERNAYCHAKGDYSYDRKVQAKTDR